MLKLTIVSPEKIEFEGEVEGLLVPGASGEFEILVNHAPIISALNEGTIEYFTGADRKQLHVTGGFVQVMQNNVKLCVEI